MANYSDEEWESIAAQWRKAAGMNDVARLDAPSFIRWLKHNSYIKDYVCVPIADLPTSEGKYEPDEGKIYFRQSTWQGAQKGNPHDIWTLMHEASHVILKHGETRLRAANINEKTRSRRAAQDEIDANRLTASIIAPFDKANFRLGTTADVIAAQFGLSYEAADRRVKEFERVYRRRNGIPRPLPSGVVDFLQAQKRKGYPITNLTNSLLLPVISNKRYEGEPCPSCGEFKMVRTGLCMRCDACTAATGED